MNLTIIGRLCRNILCVIPHNAPLPPLRFFHGEFLAFGIIFQLIFHNFADGEVLAFGVGEVQAADGGGLHGEAFSETGAGVVGGVEELEQEFLFRVVRAGGLARGGVDALVFFFDNQSSN